jgi:hypothetical protein
MDDAFKGLGCSPQPICDHLRPESAIMISPFTQKLLQALPIIFSLLA